MFEPESGVCRCTYITPIYQLTLHCRVDAMDPESGLLPTGGAGGKTGEVFARCGDVRDREDDLITVVALQETSLRRAVIVGGIRKYRQWSLTREREEKQSYTKGMLLLAHTPSPSSCRLSPG